MDNSKLKSILNADVIFYQKLNKVKKNEFENDVTAFLQQVTITAINTTITDEDRIYIASSAVIPAFGFTEWQYVNINEVLVYPDTFNENFEQTGSQRTIAGMVGTGMYNNVMILSKHEIQQAFYNKTSKSNTALHEFVHLIDKTDGDIDGIPKSIMDKQLVLPWLNLMREQMQQMALSKSDINPYGLTNKAEFFAVVSEYFFERPDLLKTKHPDLYNLLSQLFKQKL